MFLNFLSWTTAGLKFILSLHYLSCGWIYMEKEKAEKGLPRAVFSQETDFAIYVDSFYLMTTTISTVGYGDFKGFIGDTGDYEQEMLYLYMATLYGITLFSSVLNKIFSYKKLLTVKEIARKRASEIEIFLYDVSKRRKTKVLLTDKMFK